MALTKKSKHLSPNVEENNMKKIQLLLVTLLCALTATATEVKSPNGHIVLTFNLENGRPTYSMTYQGKTVIKPSHLGLELAKDKHASMGNNEQDLMSGFLVEDESTSTFDETWKPVWGETATIRNHYVVHTDIHLHLANILVGHSSHFEV